MYIGHAAAALAAKRARASVGLLVLLVATYTPDWTDVGLCLARGNPQPMLSHSIPAVALFAVVAFAIYGLGTRDWTGAAVLGAVVVSHYLLDLVTGSKPTWPGGPMVGLGWYAHPVLDFIAEGVVIVIGALLYARTLPPRRRLWIDVSIILGALLLLQLGIDLGHVLLKTLPKC
ncbi:MAG TPA: hypothetical protein VD771_10705 [Gemmatimonadaceae bacterium]|nr:hypothetical protein [Gemmatimonadaceae bacterium]